MEQPNNLTEHEQRMWEHYQQIVDENVALHNQVSKMRKENKHLKHIIRVWKGKYAELADNRLKTPSHKGKRYKRHYREY